MFVVSLERKGEREAREGCRDAPGSLCPPGSLPPLTFAELLLCAGSGVGSETTGMKLT